MVGDGLSAGIKPACQQLVAQFQDDGFDFDADLVRAGPRPAGPRF